MIDVGNNRHVTDAVRVVHDLTDLVNSEVGHSVGGVCCVTKFKKLLNSDNFVFKRV